MLVEQAQCLLAHLWHILSTGWYYFLTTNYKALRFFKYFPMNQRLTLHIALRGCIIKESALLNLKNCITILFNVVSVSSVTASYLFRVCWTTIDNENQKIFVDLFSFLFLSLPTWSCSGVHDNLLLNVYFCCCNITSGNFTNIQSSQIYLSIPVIRDHSSFHLLFSAILSSKVLSQ